MAEIVTVHARVINSTMEMTFHRGYWNIRTTGA